MRFSSTLLICLTTVVAACSEVVKYGDEAELYPAGIGGFDTATANTNILPYCYDAVRMNHDDYAITKVTYSASGQNQLTPVGIEGKFETVDEVTIRTTDDGDPETDQNTIDSGGTDGDWQFTNTSALNCSSPSCGTGDWYVFVWPQEDDEGDLGACANYGPVSISWERSLVSSANLSPPNASCQPGSGAFQLVPVEFVDQNANGYGRAVYRAAQISGTGRLTNAAQVSAIDVTQNGGAPLRVLKAGAQAKFTATDLVIDPALVSYPLGTQTTFAPGNIDGTPLFLHPPIPEGALVNAKVNMTWTCGTANVVARPQGYTFRTSDLGCPGIQKVTFRKMQDDILRFELYGSVNDVVDTTLDVNGNFSLAYSNFTATGRLISATSTGASLQLASASAAGLPACEPGTYSIGIEQ
jgi:hypothetical protein